MEKLLTEKELAILLVMSVSTIRRNRSTAPHRLPPHCKIGSLVRYRSSVVLDWLEKSQVGGASLDAKSPNTSAPPRSKKQAHLGAPTKAERVKKALNANK